jgi:flagellar hook-length control protein FliK
MADLPSGLGAMPMPPMPITPGAMRGTPPTGVGPAGLPAADFANDLARLAALLGAGVQGLALPSGDAAATSSDASAEPSTEADAADPIGALCAEVGLVMPGLAAPVAPAAAPAPVADPSDPARGVQVLPAATSGSPVSNPEQGRSADAPDGVQAETIAAPAGSDVTSSQASSIPGVPVEMLARPAAASHAPHAIAATVVDALQPQAPRQMAETVAWHVPAQGAAEVQIRLNPEELGPVDVQLKLDGDKVSVRFDLADERVRDVVQSSLPSLSSMLSSRGLQLDQAQVFAQQRSPHQQQQAQPQGAWSSARQDAGDEGSSITTAATRPLIRRGLLDDYA